MGTLIKFHRDINVFRDTASTPSIGKTTVNGIIEKPKETNTLADKPVPGKPGKRPSELIELLKESQLNIQ